MQQRETHCRLDSDAKRHVVSTARDIVYRQNYAVNSAAVKALLAEESLVPSAVSQTLLPAEYVELSAFIIYRTHFLISLPHSDSALTCISCWLLTFCMSLN
jgi:hypothetical protein